MKINVLAGIALLGAVSPAALGQYYNTPYAAPYYPYGNAPAAPNYGNGNSWAPAPGSNGYAPPSNGTGYLPPTNGNYSAPAASGTGYTPSGNGYGYTPGTGYAYPSGNGQYPSSVAPAGAGNDYESGPGGGARLWLTTEYLNWRIKDAPAPFPLVTGATGATLFGGAPVDYGHLNGARAMMGLWMDKGCTYGVEVGGFWLEKAGRTFAGSTGVGSSFVASSTARLFGSEANLAVNLYHCSCVCLDVFAGFRYLDLKEDLLLERSTGLLVAPLTTTTDEFRTHNYLYLPQVGGRLTAQFGPVWLSGFAKVGLGINEEKTDIAGRTTVSAAGAPPLTTGTGTFARATNIGGHDDNTFVVVPEVGGTVGVNVFPWFSVIGGYNFLYINKVVRPGNEIDPIVGVPGHTAYPNRESSFFAHGATAGLMFRW
jgi:hypothetical protein